MSIYLLKFLITCVCYRNVLAFMSKSSFACFTCLDKFGSLLHDLFVHKGF